MKLALAPIAALPETAKAAIEVAKRNAWRAKTDAERAIAQDIPDPAVYARYVSLEIAQALLNARIRDGESYHVAVDWAAHLRPYGLVEYGGRCLTAFGIAVRRALMAGEQ